MMRPGKDFLSPWLVPIWILCLTALAVGARNFEQGGIGVDGPLYALMARGIARSGDWFFLRGTVPHFVPYADHPHLGVWLIGAVFHVLPAADWSARIVGIIFYAAFLFLFFRFLRQAIGIRAAIIAVLLLWSFYRFSNYFSNAYLDPGALYFGAAAVFLLYGGLREKQRFRCALGGLCLALCLMVKGLTVLGFLPALFFVVALAWSERKELSLPFFRRFIWFCAVAMLSVSVYLALVHWRIPGLIEKYWNNQWVNRFSRQWDWSLLWSWRFWGSLARDTHYLLIPAALLVLYRRPKGIGWLPWILLGSFAGLYAPVDRVGMQYWVMLLPWAAWAIAQAIPVSGGWSSERVLKTTASVALVLLFVLQFIPIRIHGREEPEIAILQSRIRRGQVQRLVLDQRPEPLNFTYLDKYTWYADVPIETVSQDQQVPVPKRQEAYILYFPTAQKEHEVRAAGWCLAERFGDRSLFWDCEDQGR